MITTQQEILFDVMDEAGALLKMHYDEIALHKESIKLKPIWERYAALEKAGSFVVYTVRDDARLVGYSAFFIMPHMHYADTRIGINDVLFLHPDYRKGRVGLKLIQFSEQALKQAGVDKITWHVKLAHDFRPILHRLGYVDEETVCAKLL
jgi:GNAT superfamily N-acetyltransferase